MLAMSESILVMPALMALLLSASLNVTVITGPLYLISTGPAVTPVRMSPVIVISTPTPDSADTDPSPELAATAVTVVAAGAKAILDLPKTLEVLETHGVPVIGYRTDAFPAFWSRDSGLAVPTRLDSPEAIARAFRMRGALGLAGGQLVVNPIPEGAEIPSDEITPHIEQALAAAERAGITGKAVTPFLLAHVLEGTSGRSLDANVALVVNNARLATKIALAKSARRGA